MAPGLRWLPPCTLPGAWQMAIDAWLLERIACGERRGPLLRFYHWSQPTLSLGKHQHAIDTHWLRLAQEGRIALVRRPTGGSAVLHGGDLTYALLWPDPPRQRREAYRLCCRWLQEAFAAMGQPLEFGDSPARADQPNCFASSTAADLVHPGGLKRVGSAQKWRGHTLLQHGSVLLEPDDVLWPAVFGEPSPQLPPLPLRDEALADHLLAAALAWAAVTCGPLALERAAATDHGGTTLVEDALAEWEWEAIASTLERHEVRGLADPSAVSATILATEPKDNPRG